jgi:hypothetical protein
MEDSVHKQRPRDTFNRTTDNRTYAVLHNRVCPSHCGYCLLGRGCNRPGKGGYSRSWKKHRKTKYK